MAKQQPSTDMVRFQLSQFPDLKPLADRVGADGEGRGGLVREVRRLVRLGMALESVGIGARELQALMDGSLQLVPVSAQERGLAPQPIAPMIPGMVAPAMRSVQASAAVQHDDSPAREIDHQKLTTATFPASVPTAKPIAPAPERARAVATPVNDPVLEAFVV
ncbi:MULTISPECIES: hypothetical protein [Achromobacter]|uniref:Uncharacterized protein n=1 Tax=Achromobacter xylosoxidans (strain A8) TaxID=762376 RepID=E3HYG3_ACHXA|nr:hypothetical protein [Achromobacter xylosoxidans]ADP20117.1 hypothetical protein AXYL_06835 [Achromobacter xylosoxidans A8]